MVQVYIVFFKIFIFLALGFVLNKTKVIDGPAEKALSRILLTAVLPFMILNSSQHTFSHEAVNGMITCAAVAVCYYALSLIVLRLSLKKAKMQDHFQLLKQGYFVVDDDSTPEHLILNRTCSLKDNYLK